MQRINGASPFIKSCKRTFWVPRATQKPPKSCLKL